MNKTELVEQTYLAFDFLTKLFHESAYLIKEIEGLLGKEPEDFLIGKPSVSFTGRLNQINLFNIKGPEDIEQKVLIPGLEAFRKQQI